MTYRNQEERAAARKESRRKYYEKVRDEGKFRRRVKRNRQAKSKESWMVSAAKHRALKKGLEFTLEEKDVVIPEVCPVLGIALDRTNRKTAGNSPSLDRKDATKGYTKENVRVISWRANKIKADASPEEILLIYQYMSNEIENKA